MKKFMVLFLMMFLFGCVEEVTIQSLNVATNFCKPHAGVQKIKVDTLDHNTIYCNDGSRISFVSAKRYLGGQ